MDDKEQVVFLLLETAEIQQQAVGAALAALVQHQADLGAAVAALKTAGQALAPTVASAARTGATKAVQDELATPAQTAAAALEKSAAPLLARLDCIAAEAGKAEARLKGAVAWFTWRWMALAAVAAFGAILALLLGAWGAVWQERSQLADARAERENLAAEVSEAKAMLAVLDRRTGGVRYVEASDGRFIVIPKGFDALTCVGKTPCVRLK